MNIFYPLKHSIHHKLYLNVKPVLENSSKVLTILKLTERLYLKYNFF